MNHIPFRKFVITLLICGNTVNEIVERLRNFHYFITPDDVTKIFDDIRSVLPERIISLLDSKQLFNLSDDVHIQWLNKFGIFQFYDYIVRKNRSLEEKPKYFKWFDDCIWAHTYKDVMSLINIFLFNDEPVDTISDVIYVKYKRKIGVEALELYQSIYWDTENLSAKEALKYCLPFQNNALIIRQFRSGDSEIEMINTETASNDGCVVPFNFHESEYIKWKIGYKKYEAPTPKDFLAQVQTDSIYKYYEAMNMAHSIEIEEEDGSNELGNFNSTKTKKRNVEEQKAKVAKQWLDMYIKAQEHMPGDRDSDKSFFEKMKELELEFDNCTEKIARIEDLPDVQEDIKGDLS